MLLAPRRVKHRKWHRGRTRGVETRAAELAFGSFGLKCMETSWVAAKQIEAARRAILRYFKKGGKLWVRIFPDKPISKKGTEVPMGGGKGAIDHYAYPIKIGRIIFEIEGIKEDVAREAFKMAAAKLCVRTKFIKK